LLDGSIMHKLPGVNPEAHNAWSEMVTNTMIVLITFLAIYFTPRAAEIIIPMVKHLPASVSADFAAQY
jgi:hypothetical protein